jgi:Zn finger protein HypA/HybF involved in hydrogenase expression
MGIALEVYRTCRETIESHGGGRLEKVRLAVGELSAVEPDLLVYAWEAVVDGTSDVESKLEVVWHRAHQYCASCAESKERSEGSWLRVCPDCGMPLRVDGGEELDILDLSFESEGSNDEGGGRDQTGEAVGHSQS